MKTSYKVRIWSTSVYKGKRTTTYYVRWSVDRNPLKEPFHTSKLAESFRSQLVTAAREGIAFDVESGYPVTMLQRATRKTPWFDLICAFVDMKWPTSSPGHRRTTADSLVPITVAMLRNRPNDAQQDKALRKALRQSFNVNTRFPAAETQWISRDTRPVSDLSDPKVLRSLLNSIEKKLDGTRAAQDTIRLRRIALGAVLDFAVEQKILDENPLLEIKVAKVRSVIHEVDVRSVANPVQARTLLRAVEHINPHLHAFFALDVFRGLTP